MTDERKLSSPNGSIHKPEKKVSFAKDLGRIFLLRQREAGSTESASSNGSGGVAAKKEPIQLVTARKKHVYW
ncbi:unnamed protein product, partial [Mesorhabditis spiculigera]